MKKFENRLVRTSKNTLIISKILLIVLLFIAITPWFFPTSTFGEGIMGILGVSHYADNNFDYVTRNFTILNRSLGIIGSIIGMLPLFIGVLVMMKLSKNYITGEVFNLQNIKSYHHLGVIYLLSAVLLQPLSQILFSLCATINNPIGHRFIRITFDLSNLTAIFFAIMLIIISQVMYLGQKISEEQELTI